MAVDPRLTSVNRQDSPNRKGRSAKMPALIAASTLIAVFAVGALIGAPKGRLAAADAPKQEARSKGLESAKRLRVNSSGRFGIRPQDLGAVISHKLHQVGASAETSFDCTELTDEREIICFLHGRFFSLYVEGPNGVAAAGLKSAQLDLGPSDGAPSRNELLDQFGTATSAVLSVFDPDLSNEQKHGVLDRLGSSYLSSGRIKGYARGVQAEYELTQEEKALNLSIKPASLNSVAVPSLPLEGDPGRIFAGHLDRDDVITPTPPMSETVMWEITKAKEEIQLLFQEVESFQFDPEFRARGFSCCKYKEWLARATRITAEADRDLKWELAGAGIGVAQQALLTLGYDYLWPKASDAEDIRLAREDIQKVLAQTPPRR